MLFSLVFIQTADCHLLHMENNNDNSQCDDCKKTTTIKRMYITTYGRMRTTESGRLVNILNSHLLSAWNKFNSISCFFLFVVHSLIYISYSFVHLAYSNNHFYLSALPLIYLGNVVCAWVLLCARFVCSLLFDLQYPLLNKWCTRKLRMLFESCSVSLLNAHFANGHCICKLRALRCCWV